MPEFIYQFSSIQLFIFLNFILFLISLISIAIVRRHIPLDFRYQENTAIVSCSALLGIIYAVLIGFTILYQFSAFDKLEKAENLEGVTLYNIYQNAGTLPQPEGGNIQKLVLLYAKNAVNYEWPAMDVGDKINSNGKILIENIAHEIQTNKNNNTAATSNSIIQDVGILYKLHHARISTVHTTLNGHIWFVIVLATLFTLAINYLLGMEFRLHVFSITLVCIVISGVIYLLVGLDRPYQGDFVVHPDTISTLLEDHM